jgi:hypothetical protein
MTTAIVRVSVLAQGEPGKQLSDAEFQRLEEIVKPYVNALADRLRVDGFKPDVRISGI